MRAKIENYIIAITLFPVPSAELIYINAHPIDVDNISIYNALGDLVKQINNVNLRNGFSLEIGSLSDGVYTIRFSLGSHEIETKRFVKCE